MTALIASELLKLRTTRVSLGYLIVLLLLAGGGAAGQVGPAKTEELGGPHFQRDVLSSAQVAGLLALLVGVTIVTVEWRHGTITRTLLVTPRRERVIAAKEIAAVAVGALLALVAVAVVLAVAVPWISIEGASFHVGSVWGLMARTVVAAALWGALGAGFGALVQNQTAALIAAILWVVLVEPLAGALLGVADLARVADVLPAAALSALESTGRNDISPAAGGAIGLAYVLALGVIGVIRVRRSDIT